MILLITASARGEECAAELERAIGERVSLLSSFRSSKSEPALPFPGEPRAVVIDEAFLDLWPGAEDELLTAFAEAHPIFVNMAISGISRIVQSVRQALLRHDREQLSAVLAAEAMLRSELTGGVTGILLNAQLALEIPELPENAAMKIREVYRSALDLRKRLLHRQQAAPRKKIQAAASGTASSI